MYSELENARAAVRSIGSAILQGALPRALGPLVFTFTGMETLHVDGSVFHARGIVPDVVVPLDAAAYRDGRDPELEAAVRALTP